MNGRAPVRDAAARARFGALAQRSIEVIRRHQAPSGAYLAAPNLSVYRYSWLRDGSFIADAMSRAGEVESAAAFLDWCRGVIERRTEQVDALVRRRQAGEATNPAEFLHTRFAVDGRESDEEWSNQQLDGYGAWLWALSAHLARVGADSESHRFASAVEATARYLVAFWDHPCYDCWEENGGQVHVATLAAIAAGLRVASEWPGVPGTVRQAAASTVQAIIRRVRADGVRDGHLVKWLGGSELDASLLFCAVPYRLFEPDDPLMVATVSALSPDLAHGGVHRYRADVFYGGGEWILLAAVLGSYDIAIGDIDAAWHQLEWVAAHADENDHLPEQVSGHLLHPDSLAEWQERWGPAARPLLWSHAMFLDLYGELHARL
ncbi:MAG: glycoside hydrolase family 15 protein [Chloroflexota bacterium]|nr:glycoside hydrolase family 15 protein [Chloroflexota bacterium]